MTSSRSGSAATCLTGYIHALNECMFVCVPVLIYFLYYHMHMCISNITKILYNFITISYYQIGQKLIRILFVVPVATKLLWYHSVSWRWNVLRRMCHQMGNIIRCYRDKYEQRILVILARPGGTAVGTYSSLSLNASRPPGQALRGTCSYCYAN